LTQATALTPSPSFESLLTFGRDRENLSPNLSPNLSRRLSYKEREAEYIFLFGEALNSPGGLRKPTKREKGNTKIR